MQKWEYATVPLLVHATKQILDNWGDDGWELVALVPGPNSEQLPTPIVQQPSSQGGSGAATGQPTPSEPSASDPAPSDPTPQQPPTAQGYGWVLGQFAALASPLPGTGSGPVRA